MLTHKLCAPSNQPLRSTLDIVQLSNAYLSFLQALGNTLGRGDDDGDQDVIDKFLSVRQLEQITALYCRLALCQIT